MHLSINNINNKVDNMNDKVDNMNDNIDNMNDNVDNYFTAYFRLPTSLDLLFITNLRQHFFPDIRMMTAFF